MPDIDPATLPDFVTTVDGVVISDTLLEGWRPSFWTFITNNGLPTPLKNISFELIFDEILFKFAQQLEILFCEYNLIQ